MTQHPSDNSSESECVDTDPPRRWFLVEALTAPTTLSVLDQLSISGTRFAVSVLIGRICGQHTLGIYYLAISIVVLVQGIQDQVIRAPFAVNSPHRKAQGLRSYLGSMVVHQVLLSAICVVAISLFGAAAMFTSDGLDFGIVILVVAFVVPFFLSRALVRGLSIGLLEFRGLLAVDGVVAVLQLGSLAILTFAGLLSATTALLVMGASCAAVSLVWFWWKSQTFRVCKTRVASDWRNNWQFSKWALVSHLLVATAPAAVAWILAVGDGPIATGRYGAAMTVVGIAHVFVFGLANLALPRAAHAFASAGGPGVRKQLGNTALLLATPATLFVVISFFAAEQVAVLIYGPAFTGCGRITILLGFWLLTTSLGIAAGSSLWAIGQPRANLRADVVGFVTTMLLAFPAVLYSGAAGAAAALCLGGFVGTVTRWYDATNRIADFEVQPKYPGVDNDQLSGVRLAESD